MDAAECPPTFGIEEAVVVGIIAGGRDALTKAIEFAEDDTEQGWEDLVNRKINKQDFVIGITSSGSTPYVTAALKECKRNKIPTACITCNKNTEAAAIADYPIEIYTGPEFLTGSTRMKAGTAQKMVLNMISTAVMIQLGRVEDNKMVDMALSNNKLILRGTKMVADKTRVDNREAKRLLMKYGSVREAVKNIEYRTRNKK